MVQFDCIERPLSVFFYKYGHFAAQHPNAFVIFPILITACCSVGFLYQNLVLDPVFLYTPNNAPSRYEREIIHQKWPSRDGNYHPSKAVTDLRQCQVIVSSSDDGNILRPDFAKAVEEFNRYIVNDIFVLYAGHSYNYQDLCLRTVSGACFDNPLVQVANVLYEKYPANFTWPSVYVGLQKFYLASTLGGVRLMEDNLHVFSAKAWILLYQLKFHPVNASVVSGLWEDAFEEAMRSYKSPYLRFTFFHSQTLSRELHKNAERLVPRFAVTFCVLILFSILCTFTFIPNTVLVDWIVSKPTLALLGVINAGMGVVSSIGLLSLCGSNYSDIVAVMPFLVISIGVDNMFLMIASWRRTNRCLPVEERLAETLSDSAISITITATTDALSFCVGAITPIPAVQLFCIYTGLAIVFTFVYQLSFFVGLMAIYGKIESSNRNCMLLIKAQPVENAKHVAFPLQLVNLGTYPDKNDPKSVQCNFTESAMNRFFRDWYGPVLMNPIMKCLVVFWLATYVGFAIWGCSLLREGLKPVNLLLRDSYAVPHYDALEKYFWQYGMEVQLVVNNAADLSTSKGRADALSIADAFANTDHTIGPDGVLFFLPNYLAYLRTFQYLDRIEQDPRLFFEILRNDYLALPSHAHWQSDIYWGDAAIGEDPFSIKSYRFRVGMMNFQTTSQQLETTRTLRGVAGRYPDRNITTFMFFWLFTDQYEVILPNTLQNIGIALCIMLVISLLLIPQPVCAVWVALAIISIDVGVVGYMTLWSVNLDVVSMITIIMSIGFSVDFSAHISYGYVISDQEEPGQRVCQALSALGWPILQGALSTILGVVALASVDSYMVTTFFKTVFLVIVIGAIHGLVFLPVLLSICVRGPCFATKRSRSADSPAAQRTGDLPAAHHHQHIAYLPRLSHTGEVVQPPRPTQLWHHHNGVFTTGGGGANMSTHIGGSAAHNGGAMHNGAQLPPNNGTLPPPHAYNMTMMSPTVTNELRHRHISPPYFNRNQSSSPSTHNTSIVHDVSISESSSNSASNHQR